MEKLVIISILAVLIESLGNIFFVESTASKLKLYVTLALGMAMTMIWGVGVLAALGLPMPNIVATYFDYIITGIIVSRGSNFLHEFFLAVKAISTPPSVTTVTTKPNPSDTVSKTTPTATTP